MFTERPKRQCQNQFLAKENLIHSFTCLSARSATHPFSVPIHRSIHSSFHALLIHRFLELNIGSSARCMLTRELRLSAIYLLKHRKVIVFLIHRLALPLVVLTITLRLALSRVSSVIHLLIHR